MLKKVLDIFLSQKEDLCRRQNGVRCIYRSYRLDHGVYYDAVQYRTGGRNFIMALSVQLLIAGPIARKLFRTIFLCGEGQKAQAA